MTDHFDDVGAYLLGALSEPEREAFEAELERSPELRAEVEHLRVAVDALLASPHQLAPPPELKDRIMAVVNAEAELLHATGPRADEVQRRRWFLRPQLVGALAAVALLFGVVGALVGAGGERVTAASVGDAKLIVRESGHSTLTAENLEAPGIRRVYQVWLKHEGEDAPRPTNALFSTRADGTASVDVPGSMEGVEAVLVTNEPEGGSEAPTSDPVIVAEPA